MSNINEVLIDVLKGLGYDRINPEGLIELRQSIEDWGYSGTAEKAGGSYSGAELKFAFNSFMDMGREMFAPVEPDQAAKLAKAAGQAIEAVYPWGYRSSDSEP
jgi:hypothetical protein